MPRFSGKTALVTGAASGIGAAVVQLLSAEGANVVAADLRAEPLRASVAGLAPGRTLAQVGDVAAAADCAAMVAAAADRFGDLSILVSNAGIVVTGDAEATSEEDFRRVMDVNVVAGFLLTRAALPLLRQARGAVVMTSSVSGLGGDWGMMAYNASKGAVTNMVRALALDHGSDGVRVNAVAPTLTRTGMTGPWQTPEVLAAFANRIPLGRIAEPEEVALAIAFLASDNARFVTGVVLPVDGGLSASSGQPHL